MLIIRPSTLEDIPQLVALDNIAWADDINPVPIHWDSTEDYLSSCPPGSQLVAEENGIICGYTHSKKVTPLPSNSHVAELVIAVHPEHQGKGVGKKLLTALEAQTKQEGHRKLTLRVLASNGGAVEFYKRCGYQEQGRLIEEFYLSGRYVDDILMYKML